MFMSEDATDADQEAIHISYKRRNVTPTHTLVIHILALGLVFVSLICNIIVFWHQNTILTGISAASAIVVFICFSLENYYLRKIIQLQRALAKLDVEGNHN
jgi:hypothetical protein